LRQLEKLYQQYGDYLHVILFAIFAGIIIVKMGITGAVLIMAVPILIGFFFFFFKYPRLGFYTAFFLGFSLAALDRYLPSSLPYGLGIDIFLVLTFVVLIFKYWKELDLSASYNEVVLLMLLWMAYIVLQIANPYAQSPVAWFYAMRGIALYQLLIFGLVFPLLSSRKDCYRFLHYWFILSAIGALWGLRQKYIGVDPFEQAWLDAGAAETHLLWGTKLRVFSYYFDAGTFGGAMGHVASVAAILFLGPYSTKRRLLYLLVAILAFYGLFISGTRGALAVPGAAGITFVLLTKNKRLIILGAMVGFLAFGFLKFTSLGQSNYDIARLRSALNANDPSLQVRVYNRKRLTNYLSNKPFGTGIGTAGYWGRRFSPNTWMANFETDGLYTRIRAETGRIGQLFYLFIWLYLLVRGGMITWNFEDPERKYLAIAFISGYAGILLANYGNSVMTQFPNSFTTYLSVAYIFIMNRWNKDGVVEIPERLKESIFKFSSR